MSENKEEVKEAYWVELLNGNVFLGENLDTSNSETLKLSGAIARVVMIPTQDGEPKLEPRPLEPSPIDDAIDLEKRNVTVIYKFMAKRITKKESAGEQGKADQT